MLDSRSQAEIFRGKPVNLRVGRTTVVTLPSGEEVVLAVELTNGHLLLRITAPDGSQIDHRNNLIVDCRPVGILGV